MTFFRGGGCSDPATSTIVSKHDVAIWKVCAIFIMYMTFFEKKCINIQKTDSIPS